MSESNAGLIDQVRTIIKRFKKPSYETTNRKEISVRCPYCGDSKKSPSSAHLYIQMQPPFKFYCQKCTTAGVLSQQTLRDLGINAPELSSTIIQANKTIMKGSNNFASAPAKTHRIFLPNYSENEVSKSSLKYFCERYEKDFDPDLAIEKFKLIVDPQAFFDKNKIDINRYANEKTFDFTKAIGFLSADKSHVIFRDTSGNQRKRYFNLNLFPYENESISGKIYNISGEIVFTKRKIDLVIAEGIFDIIGIYEHFYKDKDNSGRIFAAACGKGYNAVIANYARMGFLDMNIIIYSDADVDITFYRDLKKELIFTKNSFLTIYYNKKEKDFGVPKERIELQKAIL